MKYKKKPVAIEAFQFDGDLTGKLYRSEEEAKRYLDKDYKDLIIQEEE